MKQSLVPSSLALSLLAALSLGTQAFAGNPFGSPQPLVGGHELVMRGDHKLPQIVKVPSVLIQAQKKLEQVTAEQVSGAKVVTLTWEPHNTYDIPIRIGMFSTIAFPKDEPVQQFAVSNPQAVKLFVNATSNVAMLKLKQPIVVAATVVTTKHIYYLQIRPSDGVWYQGVNWDFDSGSSFGSGDFSGGMYINPSVSQASQGAASPQSPEGSIDQPLFTGDPNFNYVITGKAPFRPTAVWDNGRFTWVQFASNLQELPALFAKTDNGLEIVNYTVHNHSTQLLVNRLMSEFVLKLGKEEVDVKAAAAGAKGSN